VNPLERRRRRGAIDAAMVCVILLLVVQMWLLTATLESFLAGHRGVAGAAFAVSLSLFLLCGALYLLVVRLDRSEAPDDSRVSGAGPWRMGEHSAHRDI
jgi:protein-S-isoprenylcysteine O-methyltransferase Ste14